MLSHCSEIHSCFDGAIDSAVLFCCFRGGVLCLLRVSPYITEIKDVVGNPRLDLLAFFAKYFYGCFLYNSLDVVGEEVRLLQKDLDLF